MVHENQAEEKLKFGSFINSFTTKDEIVKKIAEITCSDKSSVYRWINGTITPPAIKQKAIADYFGKSIDDLFNTKES